MYFCIFCGMGVSPIPLFDAFGGRYRVYFCIFCDIGVSPIPMFDAFTPYANVQFRSYFLFVKLDFLFNTAEISEYFKLDSMKSDDIKSFCLIVNSMSRGKHI